MLFGSYSSLDYTPGVFWGWYMLVSSFKKVLTYFCRHFDVLLLYIDILNPISSPNISIPQKWRNPHQKKAVWIQLM